MIWIAIILAVALILLVAYESHALRQLEKHLADLEMDDVSALALTVEKNRIEANLEMAHVQRNLNSHREANAHAHKMLSDDLYREVSALEQAIDRHDKAIIAFAEVLKGIGRAL